jgi:hypothetical protein
MSFEAPPQDPTNPDLLIGVFEYLRELNLVRDPDDGTHQKTLPPLWIEQRLGVPAPGKQEGLGPTEISPNPSEGGPGLTVGVETATGIPTGPYEGFIRLPHLQFVLRAYTSNIAYEFEEKLRIALNDKRGWMMYNVPVNESMIYRELQPVSRDNIAYTYVTEYQFNLTGPLTPVG